MAGAVGLGAALATSVAAPSAARAAIVTSSPAAAFADSVGVNAEIGYPNSCAVSSQMSTAFSELRVKHVRVGWETAAAPNAANCGDGVKAYQRYEALPAGTTLDVILDGLNRNTVSTNLGALQGRLDNGQSDPTPNTANDLMDWVQWAQANGRLGSVEGPNEFDGDARGQLADQTWRTKLRTYQNYVWSAMNGAGRASVNDVPVLGPSFAGLNAYLYYNQSFAPSLTFDQANLHYYPSGGTPEAAIVSGNNTSGGATWLSTTQAAAAGKPFTVSESGFHDASTYTPYSWTSQEASAIYLPRLLLEQYRLGAKRSYLFSLTDPVKTDNPNNREAHFGLISSYSGAKRWQYGAFRRLMEALPAANAAAAPTGSLDYTLGGDTSNVRQVLLGTGNGSFILALWQNASVWTTGATGTLTTPTPKALSLGLGGKYKVETVRPSVYNTLTDPTSWSTLSAGTTTQNVSVPADVVLVRLTPTA